MEEYGNSNSHIEEYGSLLCLSFSTFLPPPLALFPYLHHLRIAKCPEDQICGMLSPLPSFKFIYLQLSR